VAFQRLNQRADLSVTNTELAIDGLGDGGEEESAPPEKKLNIKILSYPENVGSSGQGHFIILKIHDTKPGKVAKGGVTGGGSKNRSLALRGSSKRVKTQISLYMPPQVEVSYKSNYEDVGIGIIADSGKKIIDKFQSKNLTMKGLLKDVKGTAGEYLTKAGLGAMDILAPGAAAIAQISSGKIQSSKMELLFKGVGRRAFNYTFVFIPKSSNESQSVDQIIFELKKAMLPTYTSGFLTKKGSGPSDRNLTIPTTFDIEYMYTADGDGGSARNNFLNKISTCYLTDLSVKYGGDRYKAYKPNVTTRKEKGAPPQRTEVSLTFNEIEIVTQEDIDLGF
jgi:hypothetical protein